MIMKRVDWRLATLFVQESKAKPCTILTLGVDIDV